MMYTHYYTNMIEPDNSISQDDLLPYVSSMLSELRNMVVATNDLPVLTYFLEMALEEAIARHKILHQN